jgi:hypothetical protein
MSNYTIPFILVLLSVNFISAQKVGINILVPEVDLDIRTGTTNDGSEINLGNLDNSYFLRLFSGRDAFPTPLIFWKPGTVFQMGTANSDGTSYLEFLSFNGKTIGVHNTGKSVFIGNEAGKDDDGSDNGNVGIGELSLRSSAAKQNLVAVGISTLSQNGIGSTQTFHGTSNTAVGAYTLQANTIGWRNTAIGSSAMFFNTTGQDNTALGESALFTNNTGNDNTAAGSGALAANDVGHRNTTLGSLAMNKNSIGSNNTAGGYNALAANISGSNNVAFGVSALNNSTNLSGLVAIGDSTLFANGLNATLSSHGTGNTAIGSRAMRFNDIGFSNTSVGFQSLYSNTSGTNNVAIGRESMLKNTSGKDNTAVGRSAMLNNVDGNANTAYGVDALKVSAGADDNTAIGRSAMINNTAGESNTAVGMNAMRDNQEGNDNAVLGRSALLTNTSGSSNSSIGRNAMFSNTTGSSNSAIGRSAMYNNTTGFSNVAAGTHALDKNTISSNLVAIGDSALFNNGLGITNVLLARKNTAVGSKSLYSNVSGYSNSAVGFKALNANASGFGNSALGTEAMLNINGNNNVAIGTDALGRFSTGSGNVAIGQRAMFNGMEGSQNTIIGATAGLGAVGITFSGNVMIGYAAGQSETGSNKLYIDNSSTFNPLIYGEFDNDLLKFNADVEITDVLHLSSSGKVMEVQGVEAIFKGSNYFDWGKGGAYNWVGNKLKIGSGVVSTPTYILEVTTDSAAKPGGGSWTALSDARLKTNVREYQAGLENIKLIRPVKFYYNDLSEYKTDTEYIGVIAQELAEIAPYMVSQNEKGYLDVNNSAMTYMLINAVKELSEKNEKLENEMLHIQAENSTLHMLLNEVEELKKRLTELEANKGGI